jgi:hypothetical protein
MQSWCWYLSRSSVLVSSGGWRDSLVFCPIFQWQLLSQLLPQWGVACPQVPEISSVVHQQSCFCLVLFFWGKVSDPLAGSLLSACYAALLIICQFCNVIWLCMLLSGSGDELCGLLSDLFQAVAHHPPTVSPSVFPIFVYWKFGRRSAPCFCPLLWWAQSTPPSLLHVPFQFLVYYSLVLFCFVFLQARGQSVQGAILVYPRGGCGNTACHLFAICWSAGCLSSRFRASFWWCGSPPVFSV